MSDEKTLGEIFQRQLNLGKAVDWINAKVHEKSNPEGRFIIDIEQVLTLHTLCMENLLPRPLTQDSPPGVYRTTPMHVGSYTAPPATEIQQHMRDFIGHLNQIWKSSDPIDIGAYTIWKMNWIHPFSNGNGRTSRLFSYFLMNMKAGYRFPSKSGSLIPEQLGGDKRPNYVEALRAADGGNMKPMKDLLSNMLILQLKDLPIR